MCVNIIVYCVYVSIALFLGAARFQAADSRTSQAAVQQSRVATRSLNLGRDDLYVLTDVPRLKYELEVSSYRVQSI